MQFYYSTYLKQTSNPNEYYFTIPKALYEVSGFSRYKTLTTIAVMPESMDELNISLDKSDKISLYMTTFAFLDVKNIFFMEVNLINRSATFSKILTYFKFREINILECRAIDSIMTDGGKVELICKITAGNILKDQKDDEDIKSLLQDEKIHDFNYGAFWEFEEKHTLLLSNFLNRDLENYLESINENPKEIIKSLNDEEKCIRLIKPFKKELLEKEYDSQIAFKPNDNIPLDGHIKDDSNNDDVRVIINISINSEFLSSVKKLLDNEKKCFLSITLDTDGNVLQAVFKDPREINLPLIFHLKNIFGALNHVLKPLGDNNVNLRLIKPISLEGDVKEYLVVGNIQNTKFKLFDIKTMLKIINAEIFDMNYTIKEIEFASEEKIKFSTDYSNSKNIIETLELTINQIEDSHIGELNNQPKNKDFIFYQPKEDKENEFTYKFISILKKCEIISHHKIKKSDNSILNEEDINKIIKEVLGKILIDFRDEDFIKEDVQKKFKSEFYKIFSCVLYKKYNEECLKKFCHLFDKIQPNQLNFDQIINNELFYIFTKEIIEFYRLSQKDESFDGNEIFFKECHGIKDCLDKIQLNSDKTKITEIKIKILNLKDKILESIDPDYEENTYNRVKNMAKRIQ